MFEHGISNWKYENFFKKDLISTDILLACLLFLFQLYYLKNRSMFLHPY